MPLVSRKRIPQSHRFARQIPRAKLAQLESLDGGTL